MTVAPKPEGEAEAAPGTAVAQLTAEDIILATKLDTDGEYPIYILPDGKLQLKKRPDSYVAQLVVRISSSGDWEPRHELEEAAVEALRDVTNAMLDRRVYYITYEAYTPDRYVGSAPAAVVVYEAFGPAAGRYEHSRAWAIAFGWRDRLTKKYPALAPYVRAAITGTRNPHPVLEVRLPVATDELRKLVSSVLLSAVGGSVEDLEGEVRKLEEEVRRLEEELRRKRERLEALRARLESARLKERPEEVKSQLVSA